MDAVRALPALVSLIVPCRNERGAIAHLCEAALAQQLPPGVALEVLIADGRSDDGTREWLLDHCAREPRLRLIDNPARIVSAGLNRCIEQARGSFIVRWDVHTGYAPDYVAQCLAAWQRSGADNVGGPWCAHWPAGAGEEARWAPAIAAAFQSRWVVGGARSRDTAYEGEVDTVYLGAWPRETFARVGGFDEQLVRNQDDEHNLRIRRAGGRIWQSARIRSHYQPRGSLRRLFEQQRQYGYWKPFVMKKHGQPASLRHLVPGLFVAALATGPVLSALLTAAGAVMAGGLAGAAWLAMVLAYAGFVATVSAAVAVQRGEPGLLARLPAVIAAYHLGYGLGSLRGAWDVLRGQQPDAAFGRLTR
jgi:glycosyltransferase involved in cell wall biosynthesis